MQATPLLQPSLVKTIKTKSPFIIGKYIQTNISGQNKYRIYIAAATDIIAKSKEFYVYDITSVASSMGGGLGMFLGFSFLGVCKNSLDMLWNRFCKIGKIMKRWLNL